MKQVANYLLNARTIASYWPIQLIPIERPSSETNMAGGMTRYSVSPYSLDDRDADAEPKLLTVYDSFQGSRDVFTREEASPNIVKAYDRASDLLVHWAVADRDTPGGIGPAIWMCEGDLPTAAEKALNMQNQVAYMEWLYFKGQELYDSKQWVAISERHRLSGMWLGKNDPWVKKQIAEDIKKCPICFTPVHPDAYACPAGHLFRALPSNLAALNPQLAAMTVSGPVLDPPISKRKEIHS